MEFRDLLLGIIKELVIPFILILAVVVSLSSFLSFLTGYFGLKKSTIDINSIMLVSVGLLSLSIAWKKFVYKRRPHISIKTEKKEGKLKLKLINTGKSVVRLQNVMISLAVLEGDKVHFDNYFIRSFNEDALMPGEEAFSEIGDNDEVLMFKIEKLEIGDYQGELHNIKTRYRKEPYRNIRILGARLENRDSNAVIKIQKFFRSMREVPHQYGVAIGLKEFEEKEHTEIINEYINET